MYLDLREGGNWTAEMIKLNRALVSLELFYAVTRPKVVKSVIEVPQ